MKSTYKGHSLNKVNIFEKSKIIFFHICKLIIVWNLFIAKNILISQKYLFEAIQNGNKSKYSRLEQRSVIKFLVAEKSKPCEIY